MAQKQTLPPTEVVIPLVEECRDCIGSNTLCSGMVFMMTTGQRAHNMNACPHKIQKPQQEEIAN